MKKPYTPPARHRWFDDWRGAKGAALKALVADMLAMIAAYEHETGARARARRAADQRHHETMVQVVVSNLAYEVVAPSATGHMAVLTGNGPKGLTRYDNRALGKPLRKLLGHLSILELIEWAKRRSLSEAFAFAPTATFSCMVERAGIGPSDFGQLEGKELIVLTEKQELGSGARRFTIRNLVDYAETPEPTAMREEVRTLNAFLAAADITFIPDGQESVDTDDRVMRRSFALPKKKRGQERAATPTFDRCGRLYGGFWQPMKTARRAGIRIEGEPVVALDYGQMGARLAYASVGATPPEGDIYAIPGLEGHRGAVKRALNCLLTDEGPRKKGWPEEWEDEDPEDQLPSEWTVPRMRDAIRLRHPALSKCLGVGLGMKTMFQESEVMMAVLREMMGRGIVGLGIHDGLLVQASRAEETRIIMGEVVKSITSASIPVSAELLSV